MDNVITLTRLFIFFTIPSCLPYHFFIFLSSNPYIDPKRTNVASQFLRIASESGNITETYITNLPLNSGNEQERSRVDRGLPPPSPACLYFHPSPQEFVHLWIVLQVCTDSCETKSNFQSNCVISFVSLKMKNVSSGEFLSDLSLCIGHVFTEQDEWGWGASCRICWKYFSTFSASFSNSRLFRMLCLVMNRRRS